MRSALRIVTSLMGVGFALQGVGWLVDPERAAATLGMPVLDGLARSTQFGDFAAFFLTLGVSILAAIGLGQSRLLYFPAGLLCSAAFGRFVAWAAHGAAFYLHDSAADVRPTFTPAARQDRAGAGVTRGPEALTTSGGHRADPSRRSNGCWPAWRGPWYESTTRSCT